MARSARRPPPGPTGSPSASRKRRAERGQHSGAAVGRGAAADAEDDRAGARVERGAQQLAGAVRGRGERGEDALGQQLEAGGLGHLHDGRAAAQRVRRRDLVPERPGRPAPRGARIRPPPPPRPCRRRRPRRAAPRPAAPGATRRRPAVTRSATCTAVSEPLNLSAAMSTRSAVTAASATLHSPCFRALLASRQSRRCDLNRRWSRPWLSGPRTAPRTISRVYILNRGAMSAEMIDQPGTVPDVRRTARNASPHRGPSSGTPGPMTPVGTEPGSATGCSAAGSAGSRATCSASRWSRATALDAGAHRHAICGRPPPCRSPTICPNPPTRTTASQLRPEWRRVRARPDPRQLPGRRRRLRDPRPATSWRPTASASPRSRWATCGCSRLPYLQTFTAERARVPQSRERAEAAAHGDVRQPVPGVDRRPDPCRHLRLDLPGRPAPRRLPRPPGRGPVAYRQRRVRGDVGGGARRGGVHGAPVRARRSTRRCRDPGEQPLARTVRPMVVTLHDDAAELGGDARHGRARRPAGLGWIHTVPNAAVLTAGLLYGDGDFTRTIAPHGARRPGHRLERRDGRAPWPVC